MQTSPHVDLIRCSVARVHRDLEILECLGEGGFGAVHRARLRSSEKLVACKIIHVMSNQDVEQEVRILRKLDDQRQAELVDQQDHRSQQAFNVIPGQLQEQQYNNNHIVHLKRAYFDGDRFYLVMELCQGGTLLDALSSRKGMRMAEAEAATVLRGVARALLHCRARGIVHRDVKPANIMLRRKGDLRSVTLVDFGLATEVHDDPDAAPRAVIFPASTRAAAAGTSHYIAPELQTPGAAHRYNCQADIYSLGVVLHNMLTGRYPSSSDIASNAQASTHATSCDHGSVPISMALREYWGGVSMGARLLVRDMLHRDPESRPSLERILCHPWLLRNAAQYDITATDHTVLLDTSAMAPSSITHHQVQPKIKLVIDQAPNQQTPKIKANVHDLIKHQQVVERRQKKLNYDVNNMGSTPAPPPDWHVLLPQTLSSSSSSSSDTDSELVSPLNHINPSYCPKHKLESFDVLPHALRKQCCV